ncbi:MAG: rhodanese-like domain-containing protein [Hyphomicrobiaceae bacterium]
MGLLQSSKIEEVSCRETWARLSADPSAVLVDVRTQSEWAFVGLADLTAIGKQPVLLEWSSFPTSRVDPQFVEKLDAALKERGVGRDHEVLFLCRSGGRSRMAAEAMVAAGYTRCRNVAEGFEGPLDESRHRGTRSGWKSAGLPWVQG